jgi:outer membrane protein assembly factor BamB
MINKFATIVLLFFLVQVAVLAQLPRLNAANDWNNGGGNPQRNGLSSFSGPTIDSLLWEVNSGSLIGFPVYIEDNKLVTLKFISMTNAPVVCYNLNNGQLLWEKEVTGLTGRSLPLGIRDGQVYVMRLTESYSDSLYALNATTGEKIWTADVTISTYITESLSFASNGDLLVNGSNFKMYRINYLTGQKVWETNIIGIASGSGEMVAYENTGYVLKQIGGVAYLQAINLENGQQKYHHIINDTHPGGPLPQCGFMVGPNGVVYYHKQGDNITAFLDNGTSLSVLWESEIFGSAPFGYICVGSDGSIYAPSNGRILRLNPANGQKLDSTAVLANPDLFQLRPSASANGVIYATTGENNIYAFTLNLQPLWTDLISNTNTSGVAIGSNGLIAVAGSNKLKVYTPGIVVPVELTSFTATALGNSVLLKWSTSSELNNNGFEIQRQFDESDFITIGFVKGNGTTTEVKNYSFSDESLPIGNYSYKLKQIDYNGAFVYSDIVEVDVNAPAEFALLQNYPNPFNPSTVISYSIPQNSFVTLKVYDIIGNEVATLVNQTQSAGKYDIKFDASSSSNGVYLYSIKTDNFTSTKKMLLMK